ncbi:hypothetical protein ES703_117444 [subsurface metagenome]
MVFGGDIDIQFIKNLITTANIYGYDDTKVFEWHGYRWALDRNDSDRYAYIYFHGVDNEALIADSTGEILEWTGKKFKTRYGVFDSIDVAYAEIDSIHGATINKQFAYQCAGDIFNIAPNTVALLGWITPATVEQDLSPHNHDFNYWNFLARHQLEV